MAVATQPKNPGLYKLHRVFCIAFAAFAVLMLLAGVGAVFRHSSDDIGIAFIGVLLLPISIFHWFAAKGARTGRAYGRLLSRIIGTLWLFGFPIGTLLGIYTWSQTGRKWNASEVGPSAVQPPQSRPALNE